MPWRQDNAQSPIRAPKSTENGIVFIIDDDNSDSRLVATLVESMGHNHRRFDSAESFLATNIPTDTPSCVVTELRLAGMSGSELQGQLRDDGIVIPLILFTAHAATRVVVQTMKLGAVTVLDKGCPEQELWDAIVAGLRNSRLHISKDQFQNEIRDRFAQLNEREEEILHLISHGKVNKEVAAELDISVRTVEERRRRIMQKLKVRTLADLMRLVASKERVGSLSAVSDGNLRD